MLRQISSVIALAFHTVCRRRRTAKKSGAKSYRWLKPRLVAQIVFTEWTPDGHAELRDDKEARQVGRENVT